MQRKIIASIALLALIVTVYALPVSTQDIHLSAAQSDYFLKLDGVDGESKTRGHVGEIEVMSWSWGVSNSSNSTGGGGSAGKANFQDIVITKFVDKTSPSLMLACASGKHFENAVVTTNDLMLKFTDLTCTSLKEQGSNGQPPMETVSFNYSKIEMEYSAKGGTPLRATWDLKENKGV